MAGARIAPGALSCERERRKCQTVGRDVTIENLDGCNEVSLGLLVVGLITLAIWVVCMPLFDLAGVTWLQAFQRILFTAEPPGGGAAGAPVLRVQILQRYQTPQGCFQAMDVDRDGIADLTDFKRMAEGLAPPLNSSQAEFAFDGLDANQDKLLQWGEFADAFSGSQLPDMRRKGTTPGLRIPVQSTTHASYASTSRSMSMTGSNQGVHEKVPVPGSLTRTKSTTRTGTATTTKTTTNTTTRTGTTTVTATNTTSTTSTTTLGSSTSPPIMEPIKPIGQLIEEAALLADYHKRLRDANDVVLVLLHFPTVDSRALSEFSAELAKQAVVAALAAAAGVHATAVADEGGRAASVTVVGSEMQPVEVFGRRLVIQTDGEANAPAWRELSSGNGLVVKARISLPPGADERAVVASVMSGATAEQLAAGLSNIEEASPALRGQRVRASDVYASAWARRSSAFSLQDEDQNGVLSPGEFVRSAESLGPPFTASEAEVILRGLDSDGDGVLASEEYSASPRASDTSPPDADPDAGDDVIFGRGLLDGIISAYEKPPPGSAKPVPKTPITLAEFKQRMGAAYQSTQEAFAALDGDGDGDASLDEFSEGAKTFKPPMNEEQAAYALTGLDGDVDGRVSSAEFFKLLRMAHFLSSASSAPPPSALKHGGNKTVAPDHKSQLAQLWGYSSPLEALRGLDRNGDGVVQSKEFVQSAQSWKNPLSRAEAAEVFKALDTDEDHIISRSEFFNAVGMEAEGGITVPELRKRMGTASPKFAFQTLDVNGNAVLTLEEVTKGRKAFAPPLTPEEARSVFYGFDADGNGEVRLKEMLQVLRDGRFLGSEQKSLSRSKAGSSGSAPFDCKTPDAGWSAKQKVWCCRHFQRGCSEDHKGTTGSAAPMTVPGFKKRFGAMTARDAFTALDANADGSMDLGEFANMTSAFVPALTTREALYVFKGLDADRDDKVSTAEFFGTLKLGEFFKGKEAVEKAAGEEEAQPPGAFSIADLRARLGSATPEMAVDVLDADHDGGIELDELREGARAFVPPLRNDEVRQLFHLLDKDADERVSEDEFLTALKEGGPTTAEPDAPAAEVNTSADKVNISEFRERLGSTMPREAFEVLDANADGAMEYDELYENRKAFTPPLPQDYTSALFDQLDADKDHKVRLKEFLHKLGTVAGPFDCQAGLENWSRGWSPEKKRWCCQHKELACEETTSSTAEDSTSGTTLADSTTTGKAVDEKTSSKGPVRDVAEDGTTTAEDEASTSTSSEPAVASTTEPLRTTEEAGEEKATSSVGSDPYDCNAAYANWQREWSAKKKEWCCNTKHKGCKSEVSEPYDCDAAYKNWRDAWSEGKKKWCCKNKRRGCSKDGVSEPFDCQAAYNNWEMAWSEAKKAWCCQHKQMGCPVSATSTSTTTTTTSSATTRTTTSTRSAAAAAAAAGPPASPGRSTSTTTAGQPPSTTTATTRAPAHSNSTSSPSSSITLVNFAERINRTRATPTEFFQLLDADGDDHATLSEFKRGTSAVEPPLTNEEAKYAFRGLDSDRDGQIQIDEFLGGLKLGHFFQSIAAIDAIQAKSAREAAETTRAPQRTSSTAYDAAEPLPAPEEAGIRLDELVKRMRDVADSPEDVFAQMDRNGDGIADVDEFAKGAAKLDPPLTRTQAKWALRDLDADHDGRLAEEEFLAAVRPLARQTTTTTASPPDAPPAVTQAELRTRAMRWAGSMKAACKRMDVEHDGEISIDEFVIGASALRPSVKGQDASSIFAEMDEDGSGLLSFDECFYDAMAVKKRMKALGSLHTIFAEADGDGDGRLTKEELISLGAMLKPPVSRGVLVDRFGTLDANKDGFIGFTELMPNAAPDARTGEPRIRKANTSTTPLAPGSSEPVSDEAMKAYRGVPAVLSGVADVALYAISATTSEEPDAESLVDKVGLAFSVALSHELGIDVHVVHVERLRGDADGRKSHFAAAPQGKRPTMTALVKWTATARDGGGVEAKVQDAGERIERGVEAQIADAEIPGLEGGSVQVWSEVRYDFYGPAAKGLPAGPRLEQEFGGRARVEGASDGGR